MSLYRLLNLILLNAIVILKNNLLFCYTYKNHFDENKNCTQKETKQKI